MDNNLMTPNLKRFFGVLEKVIFKKVVQFKSILEVKPSFLFLLFFLEEDFSLAPFEQSLNV